MLSLDIAAEGATPPNARVLTETTFFEVSHSSASSRATYVYLEYPCRVRHRSSKDMSMQLWVRNTLMEVCCLA